MKVFYCCRGHQVDDWADHQAFCKTSNLDVPRLYSYFRSVLNPDQLKRIHAYKAKIREFDMWTISNTIRAYEVLACTAARGRFLRR